MNDLELFYRLYREEKRKRERERRYWPDPVNPDDVASYVQNEYNAIIGYLMGSPHSHE